MAEEPIGLKLSPMPIGRTPFPMRLCPICQLCVSIFIPSAYLFNPFQNPDTTHSTSPIKSQFMASLLFLAFLLSINGLMLSDSLITFANQNPNNYLIFIAVYTFLFFLVPFEFISAIILLLLQVAIPQSAFFIKHLTRVTQVLVSATLLVGVPLMVHVTFTEAVVPDTLNIMLIAAAMATVVTVYKYNSFKRYFNYAGKTVSSFVPAFDALCISTGTFLSFSYQNHGNPFIPIPIQLFLLSLNCFNFLLAVMLLFFSISVPPDRPETSIHVVLVEFSVEAVLTMSSTTIGLIGFYMVVAPLVRIM